MSADANAVRGEIRTEVRERVGWVTLSRPEKRNALTAAMWRALPGVIEALVARDDLVALALQGAEGTFGAGADLEDVLAATAGKKEAEDYCSLVVGALLAVASAPIPTFAVVAGVAAGGGAELALACDLRIAAADASFAFPFARLGVVPDRFTLDRLTATVGATRARRLVFTGEVVAAPEALAIGLVDRVVETPSLAASASAWMATLESGSRTARNAMKRMLAGPEASYDRDALVLPMAEAMISGDVRAAALRFLAKRT